MGNAYRVYSVFNFGLVQLLAASCLAGVVLQIGSSRAFAEPALLPTAQQTTVRLFPAGNIKQAVELPQLASVRVVVMPLELQLLPATAYADWDRERQSQ